jgi:DNA ligase-associated metallophosphoesterase
VTQGASDKILNMPHTIELAGETVTLCPERAMFWPKEKSLLIADVHFGKARTFRARGIFVPHGTTADNLERLETLISRYQPERIIFLGDLLHAREAQHQDLQDQLFAWRQRHAQLQLSLVLGNHDAHAGAPDRRLGIELLDEPSTLGPFALRHHPKEVEDRYVLAGHLHPGYVISGKAHQSARLPCFWLGQRVGVLPAFGAFTGAYRVEQSVGERVFLAGPDKVRAIPEQFE